MFWCKASILDDFRVGEWELEKHLMRKATQGNRGDEPSPLHEGSGH